MECKFAMHLQTLPTSFPSLIDSVLIFTTQVAVILAIQGTFYLHLDNAASLEMGVA